MAIEIEPATEITAPAAPIIAPEADYEARFAALETEKENYRKAYLKEVDKGKKGADGSPDLSEEERMKQIADKAIADSHIADIVRQQDEIIAKALKENKELKLSQANKGNATPPAAAGAHSEATPVRDTTITAEQLAQFKSWGWDDKKIERYKQNLRKNAR